MFLILAVADESADEQFITIFEENFEDYENNVNVSSTLMPNFFVCDYNAIGDGVIHVQETANGNLHLKSHVFTQIYSATPIVGAYEFSLDILEAQGLVQTGVFIRAPKTDAVFYEADGHPDTSTGQAGLFLYVRDAILGVNVKTYDENASSTAFLQNNTVEFSLPEGVTYPYTIRAVDTGAEITLHVNDTLICSVTFSDPGKVYSNHQSKGKFFGTAKLFDAEGKELATYTDPLLSSDASYIGWTTRAADMRADNKISTPPDYNCKGMTYFMLHDPCRQGPFAMLVKDVAFCHDEIGNHNYLSIPECVEDMGAGIAKLFYNNSKSAIVKFRAIPQFEAEAYLESVLCYLYCALNHKNLFIECNTCYEAPLHRIFPEDIVYVEEVLDGAKVSYQRVDQICK